MERETGFLKRLGQRIIGENESFSFGNRAFNAVCAVSIFALAITTPVNIYVGLYTLSTIDLIIFIVVGILYYNGRTKKKFHSGIIVYAIFSYILLIATYYYNSGIDGPTIFAFFLSLHFIIALVPRKQYRIWLFLHLGVVLSLLCLEYYFPGLIHNSYPTRSDRFLDIATTYVALLICTYTITNYMRRNIISQRKSAIEKAEAIAKQNQQIIAQKQELEESNEEKNKLFSIIAHDLRSPLNSIQSFLELLSEHQLEQDEKLLIERELLALTKNTSDMLFNLLSWSKAQMDGVTVKKASINVYETLSKTLDIQSTIAHKKTINLVNAIDQHTCIVADRDMLQLVIRNLVNNAIKFTPEGGKIIVSSEVANNEFILAVKDNGIGISFEMQDGLFSLRTKSTFGTNNEKGVGLGLVLCKEFTELQGGKIWFQSTPKVGTAFYISIPICHDGLKLQTSPQNEKRRTLA